MRSGSGRDGDLAMAATSARTLFAFVQIASISVNLSSVSVKEQVLQAINRLPDDIDYRDAADEIAFLAAVREAEHDIEHGRVFKNEQMKARIDEWTGS